jgi:hypothetical protein
MGTLTPAAVDDLVVKCLAGSTNDSDLIKVAGIVNDYGFSAAEIEEHKTDIRNLVLELNANFMKDGGGGWSFLQLCEDRNGKQWTGLHRTMEGLCCLSIAAGIGKWLLSREHWKHLPGGMPYIAFDISAKEWEDHGKSRAA